MDKFDVNKIGNIAKLPDQVVGSAVSLKQSFDENAKAIAEYINGTLAKEIDGKLSAEDGKGLSSNDYTNEDRKKLEDLPTMEEYESEMSKKASIDDIPEKISQLVDDTENDGAIINWAKHSWDSGHSDVSEIAIKDRNGADIVNTYATKEKVNEIEAIAKGRATGYVFDTKADMIEWVSKSENASKLNLGDNLYIREVNVPDYWWDGSVYQVLETQKVDLTEYAKRTDVPVKISQLVDDTNPGIFIINYANSAKFSEEAGSDSDGRIFQDFYATKAELTEAIGEALEGEY